jgi:hypothetical protein
VGIKALPFGAAALHEGRLGLGLSHESLQVSWGGAIDVVPTAPRAWISVGRVRRRR